MVKVAIAGGSGSMIRNPARRWQKDTQANWWKDVAREVIDQILAKESHEIVVLSRQVWSLLSAEGTILIKEQIPPRTDNSNTKWVQVDYESKASLVRAFSDIDTVLSFLAIPDPSSMVRLQKNMIDAAIEAGVRRFSPSEWGRYVISWKSAIQLDPNKRIQYDKEWYGDLRV